MIKPVLHLPPIASLLLMFFPFLSTAPVRANNPTSDPGQPLITSNMVYLPIVLTRYRHLRVDLSSDWYLMVDDEHIQYRDVQRIYYPFQKYSNNPVLRADKYWEGKIVQLYGTVFPGFQMWYSSYNPSRGFAQVLYAESADGISWSKPNLPGRSDNALFNGQSANLASVLYTPEDGLNPYKLMVYQSGSFHGYYSDDGLSTTPYAANPLYTVGGDVAHFYWDPGTSQYRSTFKSSEVIFGVRRRIIRFSDSADLVNWNQAPDYLSTDIIDDVLFSGYYPALYGMPVFRLGEQYIGLLWVIKARDQLGQLGQVVVQIASSHDGLHWIREEGNRPTMLDVGPSGAWDSGQVYTALHPVKVDHWLWLYYSGCNREHGASIQDTTCSIGLARLGYNRLASLTGSGVVITQPLNPGGQYLHLNYDGRQGALRVELLVDGVAIPDYEAANCLPMTSDSQDQVVSWQAGSSLPPGPFQIKFLLDNSSLFAFAMIE